MSPSGEPLAIAMPASAEHRQRGTFVAAVAGLEQRRVAFAAIVVSVFSFAVAVPFAQVPLARLPAFVPTFDTALVIIDLITAALLFGQFVLRRSAALLALAAGYLFAGLITVPHALTFPGVLSPTGGLGAGLQTTAWLYMLWHGGFPLFVMAYAALRTDIARRVPAWLAFAATIAVIGLVILLTLLATRGHDLLPAVKSGDGYSQAMKLTVGTVWVLPGIAILMLVARRHHQCSICG